MKLCPHPLFLLLSFLQNVTCPPFSSEDYYSLEYGGLMNLPANKKPPLKPTDIHGVKRKYPALTNLRAAVEREVPSEEEPATPPTTSKNSSDATYNNIHINIMVNTAGGQITMTVSNSSAPTSTEVSTIVSTTTPEPKTTHSTTPATTKPTAAATTITVTSPITTTPVPVYVPEAPVMSKPISVTANELPAPTSKATSEAAPIIPTIETVPTKPTTETVPTKATNPETTSTTKAPPLPPKLETISMESVHAVSASPNVSNATTNPCTQCGVMETENSFIVPKPPENKPPEPSPLPWEPEPDDKVMFPAVGFNRQCRSYFDCGFQVGENKSRTWLRCVDHFCTCELLGYVRDDESGWNLSWSREAQACISSWNGPCGFSKGLEIHCHLGCECGKENMCEKPGQVWKKPTTTTTTTAPPVKPETKHPVNKPPPVIYSEEECEEEEKKEEESEDGKVKVGTGGSESGFSVFSFLLFPSLNAVNTILNQSLNSVR